VAAHINTDLIISGILRFARQQPNALAWLRDQHTAALQAVMAGDEFVTSTSFGGESHTATQGLPAVTLLTLYEGALQIEEAVEAAEAAGETMSGSVRHADFSKHPCTLG
jgi:hypothetical protein